MRAQRKHRFFGLEAKGYAWIAVFAEQVYQGAALELRVFGWIRNRNDGAEISR
jgi:hypothetical protein